MVQADRRPSSSHRCAPIIYAIWPAFPNEVPNARSSQASSNGEVGPHLGIRAAFADTPLRIERPGDWRPMPEARARHCQRLLSLLQQPGFQDSQLFLRRTHFPTHVG